MQSTTKANPIPARTLKTHRTVTGSKLFARSLVSLLFVAASCQLGASAVEEKAQREAELRSSSRLIEEKHYSEGYQSFKKLADKGCPYSQCLVGLMHKNGVGVKKDAKLAFAYFEKSANQGFADAQRWLAEMYLRGEGTAVNKSKALEWFEKAARNDIVEAQYKIGHLYRTSGAAELKGRGTAWLSKAAKSGIADAESKVNKIPQIPYSGPQNTYSNGVSNIAQSWGGYSSLAKSLSSTQGQ
jgi:TPR repeat protein